MRRDGGRKFVDAAGKAFAEGTDGERPKANDIGTAQTEQYGCGKKNNEFGEKELCDRSLAGCPSGQRSPNVHHTDPTDQCPNPPDTIAVETGKLNTVKYSISGQTVTVYLFKVYLSKGPTVIGGQISHRLFFKEPETR